MATAKYTKGKDGYFQAKVWDGTYTEKGAKHRVTLRTKKSSRALEEMVREMEEKVRNRDILKESKASVQEYARKWLEIYKHSELPQFLSDSSLVFGKRHPAPHRIHSKWFSHCRPPAARW